MRILPNNVAILDEPDQLCRWVEEAGRLCHDDGVAIYYLPHIKPGDVVIDAGAAIGDHTIAYANATGNPANVHAFECNPKMLECLRHNCPGVHVYPFALANDVKWMCFLENDQGNAGASYVDRNDISSDDIVPAITLDCLHLPRVDFIKWDIEGSEVTAIRGAVSTIKRFRPKMIVEIYDAHLKRAGSSSREIEGILEGLGYYVKPIIGDPDEGRYEALCLPI